MRDDAIGTSQLTNGAVTAAKLAANSLSVTNMSTNTSYGIAKAWAVVNSAGTLLKGFNISSVSKPATGKYIIVFGGTFTPTDTNYCISASVISGDVDEVMAKPATNTTTQVYIFITNDGSGLQDNTFTVSFLDF